MPGGERCEIFGAFWCVLVRSAVGREARRPLTGLDSVWIEPDFAGFEFRGMGNMGILGIMGGGDDVMFFTSAI